MRTTESAYAERQNREELAVQLRPPPSGDSRWISLIPDATDRTTLEQNQAQTLQFFETLFSHAPVGYVFLDRDLRFVRINQRLAEINGRSIAAHLGKTVAEILPAQEANISEVAARILATGQPVLNQAFSSETASAPGMIRMWNESWYPVRNDRAEIIGFGGVVEDVTERKQTEAALQDTNDRFELAVKVSQAVLWQQDLDLRFTWLHNPAPGIDGSNAVGKVEADLLERAEDVAVIEGLKREVIHSGVGMKTEFFPQIKGVVHCFELLMEPLRDAAGRITGLTGAAIDITERKRTEAALHETERNYRALAEASSEVAYRMSADWSNMLPLDGRELVASSDGPLSEWAWLEQNLPADEHARVRQAISDAIARKGLFELVHRVVRPDGSTGWTLSRAVPLLDENQGVVAWFGAASDITERKQAQERLEMAIAGSDLGTWHWDILTGELDWSQRCLKIFGIPAGTAMTYEKFLGAIHPEDRARADDAVRHALQEGSEYRVELRTVWPDGSVHWAVSIGRAYYAATGKPIRMEGIALDITEPKRGEAELRLINERLTLAVKCAQVVVFQMDLELRYTWILNSAPGWDDSQCIGKRNADLVDHAEDAAVYDALKREVIRTGVGQRAEIAVRLQGALRHFDLMVEPLRDAAGLVSGITCASIEITTRKQADESRRLLASIVENARDFIGIADTHGNPIYGNRAALEFVGFKDQEQVRGSNIVDYFVAEQRQFVEEVVLPTAAADGRWAGELTMQHFVTGATFPVWYDLFRVDDPVSGQPVNYATITRDLTELKKTEEALREKTHFLKRIAEVTPGVLHVYDLAQRRAVFINRSIASLLGYSPEEVLAMGANATPSLMHTEDLPQFDAYMARVCALADGEVAHFEFRIRDRGGVWHWFLSHDSVFSRDATGAALQTIGVASEITERKEAERVLADRTELLNGVMEGTTDVIFVKDLNGRMLLGNAAFAAAARRTPEQLVGMTDEELFPPDVAAAIQQHDAVVLAGGSPIQIEELILVAGEARVFHTLKAPLRDSNSRIIGILGLSRDITERKQVELNLIAATAVAENANRAKSDFLSSMSHELRTPLNAILGFAQLIESGDPVPTPVQKRNLEQIIKGGWYLLDLVNDLLDLAQIESGKLSLTQESVSLTEVMLDCQALIGPQARERQIAVTFPTTVLSGCVRADRTRVKQVFINLLSNAIKYNKPQGSVTVEVAKTGQDAVRVSVRDTGEGLPPEKLAQLFQPFNRLGRESGPEQGTGIGLVMCRRLVESMGGSIGVESAIGLGTVVWFELKWV